MPTKESILSLENFYPKELIITSIDQYNDKIIIHLKSVTENCICPRCNKLLDSYHGTYIRKVQDLPILGKKVQLEITAHEYQCDNEECQTTTIAESYDGFLSSYGRMTERCIDFICSLALQTSCEGSARICRKIGINISGDSVIRLLLKRYEAIESPAYGDVVGIDDFAFKKRNTYGTIIVDEQTHNPIAVLEGRDGKTLRQWLKNNKHIKTITRDRASAYAKVIAEELPDVMQIADRFHLHQNLLEAIKQALGREVPATVKIIHEAEDVNKEKTPCKKKSI